MGQKEQHVRSTEVKENRKEEEVKGGQGGWVCG